VAERTARYAGAELSAAIALRPDHQPARIIFPDKHRPKGLEFPACADCNRQTSADEALLAFVCRFAGSHRTNAARDFNRLKDIVGSVNQSFPGLRQKMHGQRLWAMERDVWVRVGAIDVNQPEVNLGLCRIAAKLALAIYYESRSSPASKVWPSLPSPFDLSGVDWANRQASATANSARARASGAVSRATLGNVSPGA
jgi:hypothetical protein